MRIRLVDFLVGALLLLAAGCAVREQLVIKAPPPVPVARVEVVPAQPGPGHVWVAGHWAWRGPAQGYVWVPGHWIVPQSPGYIWVSGRWEPRPGGYMWIEGHWRPR